MLKRMRQIQKPDMKLKNKYRTRLEIQKLLYYLFSIAVCGTLV